MKKKIHPDSFSKNYLQLSLEAESPTTSAFIRDLDTKYVLNSLGYRSPEFAPVDILSIGCSQTVGLGVDEDDIWPKLLSNLTGMSYSNLGIVGNSAQGMLENLLSYVKIYGPPKIVCALYPSMYRLKIMLRKDMNVALYHNEDLKVEVKNVNLSFASEGIELEKMINYAKRPYSINDVLAYEVGLHQSVMAIRVLSEYCRTAGIKLIVSTWEPDANEVLKDVEEFVALENLEDFFYSSSSLNCHPEKQGDSRDKGRDSSGHMGSHQHLHFAELFAEIIKENK